MENKTILLTAPYMIPFVDRFIPVLESSGLDVIVPDVEERMEAADLLKYAGQFDGAICVGMTVTRLLLWKPLRRA